MIINEQIRRYNEKMEEIEQLEYAEALAVNQLKLKRKNTVSLSLNAAVALVDSSLGFSFFIFCYNYDCVYGYGINLRKIVYFYLISSFPAQLVQQSLKLHCKLTVVTLRMLPLKPIETH